jgi:hypothetical protein
MGRQLGISLGAITAVYCLFWKVRVMILLSGCRYAEIRTAWWVVVLAWFVSGAMQPVLVYAETKIAPLATLSGLYDSNIWNQPAQLLAPGTQLDDFHTSIGGGARVLHDSRDVEATFDAGGNFNFFAQNTNLNFAQMNVKGSVGLDRWVDQYVRGASLRVLESFRYSPDPPAFLGGIRNVIQQEDTFLRGVIAFRSNQIRNTTSIEGKYPLSRELALEGGYEFGLLQFGAIQGGEGLQTTTGLFNTMTHTWFGGPRYQLTRNDSVAALYRQTFFTQSQALSSGSRTFNTNLIALAGSYTKMFQEWRLTLQGGLTFAEPVGRTFPSGTIAIRSQPERDTVVMLTLSREGRPSGFLQGGAMISNLAQVGISHRIYERLTVNGRVGYAYNELFPSTDSRIKTFTASSTVNYKLTRTMAVDFVYLFRNIDVDVSALEYQFSRHQVGLTLSIALDPLGVELWD